MADHCDMADELIEHQLARALARHQQSQAPTGAGALECEDCGDPIPAPRRAALPWCVTCVDCQGLREQRR
jgi:phage/conjugal plasmid C-4 type zinc finger TraR family protein